MSHNYFSSRSIISNQVKCNGLLLLALALWLSFIVPQAALAQKSATETSSKFIAEQPAKPWFKSPKQVHIYFPGKGDNWERKKPEEVGMNSDLLQAAVDFAIANENKGSKILSEAITSSFSREPNFSIIGPTKPRGSAAGIVLRNGYIVAEFGDIKRVDMTFSATKSYLSTMFGLAYDAGLIEDVHDLVGDYVREGSFDSPKNANIEWHHLLNQTSDWEGTLWDKPDWADRPEGEPDTWENRKKYEPGERMKYNDVRVNLLAYALLHVWRRPLPQILREEIMDPIGSSPTWRWYGYENSWVTIDGLQMQSVSGGGHWGGGMFISALDHARFGYLFLKRGNWNGKQLISEAWIDMLQEPTPANPIYGYMWWLNTGKRRLPNAPEKSYFAAGFGGNYVWVDPGHDLVIVLRWVPNLDGVIERVLVSIESGNK